MKLKNYFLFIFFIYWNHLFYSCNLENKSKKNEDGKQKLITILLNSEIPKSDCIYCTDTQAFHGNCTCYFDIELSLCKSFSNTDLKNSSEKVSCSYLTTEGGWIQISEKTFTCSFETCPAEAYQSAFTK